MTERKRWEKHQEFHPSNTSSVSEAKEDPVLTKQLRYLQVLEERNRIKKRLAASKRNDRLHEREEAFVTSFNVPIRNVQSTTSSSLSSRNTKSATSVLPTNLEKRDKAKCRSAPSTTLNFASKKNEEKRKESIRGKRAKWHRPQAPMEVTVQHQDGVPQFRLMTHEESEEKEGLDDDENYLNESFEEFEEKEEEMSCINEELVIEEMGENIEQISVISSTKEGQSSSSLPPQLLSSIDLAQTTKDLFGVIQHLSRTKQRALVDLLQKFQTGKQDEDDFKTLKNSIGDPAIWNEITTVLNPLPSSKALINKVSDESITNVRKDFDTKMLEDQLRLENEYASEMKMRLVREREAKQVALKKAEDRRAKMMKELEEEEREIERLMEVKRNERLAKLKALQDETNLAVPAVSSKDSDKDHISERETKLEDEWIDNKPRESRNLNESDSDTFSVSTQNDISSVNNESDVKKSQNAVFRVPRLDFSFTSSIETRNYEIHIKLLSTWGNTRAVGLARICVYDHNDEELSVDLNSLQLYDQLSGRPLPKITEMVRGLQKLFTSNNMTQTKSETDMWLGRLGDSDVLIIEFSVQSPPSKLCIWNYNGKTLSACTRDLEVVVCGKSVWMGSLPECYGDAADNVCTSIDLLGSARKGLRSVRDNESSTLSNRMPSSRHNDNEAKLSQQNVSSRRHDASTEKLTPMWLPDTIPVVDSLLTTSRSADLNLLSSMNNTSRRRHGSQSSRSGTIDTSAGNRVITKSSSSQVIECKEDKGHNEQVKVSSLASLSSWDSLEKFSKRNRNRLTQEVDKNASKPSKHTENRIETFSEGSTNCTLTTSVQSRQASMPAASIPIFPKGKWLKLEILSTWGDPYYVGLNGIEIFDHCGKLVQFHDPVKQIVACPDSINVLEENSDDPRVPKNLVDGVNFTCDDFHMWLAPFTAGKTHYVLLAMDSLISIAMIRLWNYNKSRTHTCRGVREARLILYDEIPATLLRDSQGLAQNNHNGTVIFEGEIRQAPGIVGAESVNNANEVILFTREPAILKAIEANDKTLRSLVQEQEGEEGEVRELINQMHRSIEHQRPRTSDVESRTVEKSSEIEKSNERYEYSDKTGRPRTMATRKDPTLRTSIDTWVAEAHEEEITKNAMLSDETCPTNETLPCGRHLVLRLHSTWGDQNYIGLTQVQVLVGSHGTPYPIQLDNLDATPRDLASLGYMGDPRTLDKLIDGETTTCDDTHMWLVPFESGKTPELRITFQTMQFFFGLRVWNYNKSLEDTYRGVKQVIVTIDGVLVSPKKTGYLLRKAPGVCDFDFGQLLFFSLNKINSSLYSKRVHYPFRSLAYKTPIIRQDYEVPLYPQGFLLKIICWTTWGDPYYLGLNGLELYEFDGARIVERPNILTANPYSISELGENQQDSRIPENLMSGNDKNTWKAHDAWLAPLASSLGNEQGNIVYIGFDTPIVLSMIKFWNYSKTPERGVKDVTIYLDDMHLFSGRLKKAPEGEIFESSNGYGKIHRVMEQFGQPVLFSTSQAQVDGEKRNVYYCGCEEQDVLGINEGQVMEESKAMYQKPDPGAQGVHADLALRPLTAVCRY
ncbi:putative protein KIAA0556 [Plasmopara halstedii]